MMQFEKMGEGIFAFRSENAGRKVCISYGVHGNEQSPIEAGEKLRENLENGELELARGSLLLIFANQKASEENKRWSSDGVDLNRCFHADVLAREPELYEEGRAREIVASMEDFGPEVLVDFHCTVEPGEKFLMQHPPVSDVPHHEVTRLLQAETVLGDPDLTFGGVSFDEWMSTRGRVGICYETGWMDDPENTGENVLGEMLNILGGLSLLDGQEIRTFEGKSLIELAGSIICEEEGFAWDENCGQNLQRLTAGQRLGVYASGKEVSLAEDATLIFPKKRAELLVVGKPMVFLARQRG